MLIWKTESKDIRNRNFIENYNDRIDLKSLYNQPSDNLKRLVLDGQQRLQSLFTGLRGRIDNRELHFNLLSGTSDSVDETKFKFEFKEANKSHFPWALFKTIIEERNGIPEEIAENLISEKQITEIERKLVVRNISIARNEFITRENIFYSQIEIEEYDSFDDIVEIFIRANNGGTKLSKSDLMFSLIIKFGGKRGFRKQHVVIIITYFPNII
jgi:uncharacterized protein with ParB-like and HNH nuclease domain